MKIINTELMTTPPASETEKLWVYNGLDTMITREVFDVISRDLDERAAATYYFSRELQGPVLEMKMRGVKVNLAMRERLIKEFEGDITYHSAKFNRLVKGVLGNDKSVNWRSPAQVKQLIYGDLGIPAMYRGDSTTVDRTALEKLKSHFDAEPFINYILALRDIAKKVGVLKSEIDPDGRIRTSYNIAGTNTGRFSSSFTDFGTGTNLQNIEKRLRRIFVADDGMKFAQLDAEQGDSRCVGAIEWNLFRDGTYLDACESGDLHTTVCAMAWPDLQWTGNLQRDRELAEQPFYRQHSFRHMAKVLGHGTNYCGSPSTMAEHTKIDTAVIKEFQALYFKGFPAHLRWHAFVANALRRDGFLTTLLGRRRRFMGRLNEPATHREAVAFDPQSSCSDTLNRGMLQVWKANIVDLLMQIHDAILVQYPEEREAEIVPRLRELIRYPIVLQDDRVFEIPYEVKTGWNWSDWSNNNPNGLKKFNGSDSRSRVEEA